VKTPPVLFQKTIEVRDPAGETAFGELHGRPRRVRARVTYKRRLVKGTDGQDIVAEATVQTSPDERDAIDVGAEISFDGKTMTAVAVSRPEALNAKAIHQEVALAP
jgi:hypothetical protein